MALKTRAWWISLRPKTLLLSLMGSLLPFSVAQVQGLAEGRIFLGTCFCAMCLQMLSNLANDLGDQQHGADNARRIGPIRPLQAGMLSQHAFRSALVLLGSLAFLSGGGLLYFVFGFDASFWVFLGLGFLAIFSALRYTYGRNPYGYRGLGDLFVFVFFGWVLVAGGYYLYAQTFPASILLLSCSYGCGCTLVLHTNNLRDMQSDSEAGKRTLAVMLGAKKARFYLLGLCVVSLAGLNVAIHLLIEEQTFWHAGQYLLSLGVLLYVVVQARGDATQFLRRFRSKSMLPRMVLGLVMLYVWFVLSCFFS